MTTISKISVGLCFLLITGILVNNVNSAPSKAFQYYLNKPISAFDLYLYKLYDNLKCSQSYYIFNKTEQDFCMQSIEYNSQNNLIIMNFFIGKDKLNDKEFSQLTSDQKKNILYSFVDELAVEMGIEKRKGMDIRLGFIQHTSIESPLLNDYISDEADVFYEDVTKNTELNLFIRINKKSYQIRRDNKGNKFFVEE